MEKLATIGLTANDLVNIFVVEATNLLAEPLMGVPMPDPNSEEAPQLDLPVHYPDEQTEPDVTVQEESSSFDSTLSHSSSELRSFRKKLIEDERLAHIYKLRHNFSERFDNCAYIHPHGTTNFDYKSIKDDRRQGFEKFKNKIRQENYMYLGNHPEIRALISMFLKKLLTAQPPDPTQYMAEFFTSRITDTDFQTAMEHEIKRISRYRVNKMSAQGRIKIGTGTAVRVEGDEDEEADLPEADVNLMKKLNIGPLAQDFYFDASFMPKKKEVKPPETPKKKKKPKKHKYCGCKDYKVRARQKKKVTQPSLEGNTPATGSTEPTQEGMMMPSEEETEYDDDEEQVNEVLDRDRIHPQTEEDAEMMASELVNGLIGPSSGQTIAP